MPVELLAEASSKKNFYTRFHCWQTVLLECDSNLANSCCVIEKKLNFWKVFFCKFSLFSSYFLPVVEKQTILTQITTRPK